MTIDEMKKKRDALDKEIKQKEDEKLAAAEKCVSDKIRSISDEEKKTILSHMQHDRSSCSDTDPCNGLYSSSDGGYRCRKCMMIEIFNGEHGGLYDFEITAEIFPTKIK